MAARKDVGGRTYKCKECKLEKRYVSFTAREIKLQTCGKCCRRIKDKKTIHRNP